jgi:beta-lactamase regulating signal transducer with metallopeptidase domain
MLDLAVQWVVVTVDISVKVMVLAAIAMLSLRLLKLYDSNLRHRTWTGVLIGMLLLPVLSQTLPTLPLPVAVPEHWKIRQRDDVSPTTASAATDAAAPIAIGDSQASSSSLARHEPSQDSGLYRSQWSDDARSARSDGVPAAELGTGSSSPELSHSHHPLVAELDNQEVEVASSAPTLTVQDSGPPLWPASLLLIWLAGAGVMGLRLLAGVAYSLRLAWSSTVITTKDLAEKGVRFRWLTGAERPAMTCECPLIRVPVALGVIRPRILLPSDWRAWSAQKLLAAIAHEQTHIRRADGAVIFLAELNRCLYWFHPVAWWLRSQLGQLAETACDDAAIDCIGDRATYARHLLEVASAVAGHRGRLIAAGISMARRSNVETRINAILDFTRPLSRRLTWTTTLLLFSALVPLITLAAVVQPSTQADAPHSAERSAADAAAVANEAAEIDLVDGAGTNRNASLVAEDQQRSENDSGVAKREESGDETAVSYSGRVETPQGQPIAGAKIWLAVTSYEINSEANWENREGLLRELGTADEQGRFKITLDASTMQEIRKRRRFAQALVLATAEGRGLDWLPLDVFEDNPARSRHRDTLQARIDRALGDGRFAGRTLKLRPESRPVRGRLVDLDGRPLRNATVLVESLKQPDIPRLVKAFEMLWIRELNEALSATAIGVGGLARGELRKLIPATTTDDNGEFELRGIGDDQLVTLVVNADRVEARPVHVFGREMEAVSLSQHPGGAKDVYVGRDFTYALGPSVPVEGVVSDYDTGRPVANVLVYVERLFKYEDSDPTQLRLDTCHMRAVTDEQGRFRITGMPPGKGHFVEAVPPQSEPYMMMAQEVSPSLEDGDAKRIEIQVKRGIWIEGRITDKQSGKPVLASVDYMALRKNPHAVDNLGLDVVSPRQRYWTDSDGRYRTLGLPGPGVLLVRSQVPGYPLASDAETIDGYDAAGGFIPTAPYPARVSEWHLLKQIDPATDASSFTCDLVFDTGVSIPGRAVGPGGKPITDLFVFGQTERDRDWRPRLEDVRTFDRFTVNGYDGKGPRQLFFKNQDESLVGQFRLEGDAPEEILVTLQPSVRVTGRLIDHVTDLPAARYFLLCEKCTLFNEKHPPVDFRIHWCFTDDEGHFEIKGLMAGLAYTMNSLDEGNFRNSPFTIDLTAAKPGDVIEIGDVGLASESDSKN